MFKIKLNISSFTLVSSVFFTYSGYYLILAFLLAYNIPSTIISFTLRLLVGILMLFKIFTVKRNMSVYVSLFGIFSAIYIFKILVMQVYYWDDYISKPPYYFLLYFILFGLIPFSFFSRVRISRKIEVTMLKTLVFAGVGMLTVCGTLYREVIFSGLGRLSDTRYMNVDFTALNPLTLAYSGSLLLTLVLASSLSKLQFPLGGLGKIGTIALALGALLLGASKGGIFSLVFTSLLLMVGSNALALKAKMRILLVIIVLVPLGLQLIELSGSTLITRFQELGRDNSSSERLEYYSAALLEFSNNPLLGGRIEVSGIYPHNIIVESLMATGLIGSLIFIVLIVQGLYSSIRQIKRNFIIGPVLYLNGFVMLMFSDSISTGILFYSGLGLVLGNTENLESYE